MVLIHEGVSLVVSNPLGRILVFLIHWGIFLGFLCLSTYCCHFNTLGMILNFFLAFPTFQESNVIF